MIEKVIENAIRMEIENRVKRQVEDARAQMERQIAEIAASVSIIVLKKVSMQMMSDQLIIRVDTSKP